MSAGLATDVVAVQGLSVKQQAFGTVSIESDSFSEFPNSGLLGVAFSSISASKQKTLVENLIEDKQLAAPMFSVHLTRGQETGSEVRPLQIKIRRQSITLFLRRYALAAWTKTKQREMSNGYLFYQR